jgi:hypothetical protein
LTQFRGAKRRHCRRDVGLTPAASETHVTQTTGQVDTLAAVERSHRNLAYAAALSRTATIRVRGECSGTETANVELILPHDSRRNSSRQWALVLNLLVLAVSATGYAVVAHSEALSPATLVVEPRVREIFHVSLGVLLMSIISGIAAIYLSEH